MSLTSIRLQIFSILFPKTVVHKLVQVLFERALDLLAELRVHADVWCNPQALVEAHSSMDFLQAHSEL